MDKEEYLVYGAGRIGIEIVDLLLKMKKNVVMIWDRNSKKEGVYQGIPIRNPYKEKQLIQESKNCKIIIGLANPLENEKIYQYFCKEGYKQVYRFSGGVNRIESFCRKEEKLEEYCVLCACAETCEKWIKENLEQQYGNQVIEEEKIILALSVSVTNRCTLNCNYCVQCTDEVKTKGIFYDMNLDSLKKYVKHILKEVCYIHQFTLTGGEVLLCKELSEMLDYLSQQPQIGYVKILTTATVLLSDSLIEKLKNPKFIVWVDMYGEEKGIPILLQTNLKLNIEKLVQNKILYHIIDNRNGTWYDLGDKRKREDTKENEKKNKECMFRTCLLLSAKGNLSWCARNVFCLEYGLIPKDKRDYCDLSDEQDCLRVKEILQLSYLHGCEYCNGTNEKNMVIAGEQKFK